uniref:Cyclin-dependent kinases regulatory subunit n=1 Tax=Panagrolaimus superbus TaxID=310955 RepID=A0A914YFN4_9BILA
MSQDEFYYSNKYEDDKYEYRHVHVPKSVAKLVPKNKLMTETEWRNIGIQQSPGWQHYMVHGPERHIILFRRLLPGKNPNAVNRAGTTNEVGVRG